MSHYKFFDLSYSFDDLEPVLSAEAMSDHHQQLYRAYCDKLNAGLTAMTVDDERLKSDITLLLSRISEFPQNIVNSAGGYFNHTFLWQCLSPKDRIEKPNDKFSKLIDAKYGSYANLCQSLIEAGLTVFGSGFVWLVLDDKEQLNITTTANQDNPLMNTACVKGKPLMAIDVWEHAYYLDYSSNRRDYLETIFQVISWSVANSYFK